MQEWIQVDLDTKKLKQEKEVRGVVIELLVSPYDIPEAVRGFFNNEKNHFAIEFKYVGSDNEPTKNKHDDEMTLITGENSGRLYRLEVDVKALDANAVGLQMRVKNEINEALDQLINQPSLSRRSANYKLAKEAIASSQGHLFDALPVAA